MWYKPYGKSGKEISVVGFGGMRFADPEDIDANAEIVLHAYNRGINYFDTAPGYCKDKSEDIIGAAVKQMKPGTFYISTKCGNPDGGEVTKSLDKSLKRLNVERIDFFHIWCVYTFQDWQRRKAGGAVAAALKAKQQGLVGHVAISAHMSGGELHDVLYEHLLDGVTLGYNAINFPYRRQGIEAAEDLGLGVVTMNPLGGGVIPKNAERFDFLRGPNDPSVVAAAIRFNVSHPAITSALVGFTTKQHVDEAVDAVESFQPYDQARIEQIRKNISNSFDDLCTGCGYCLPCPEGLDIPRLMDAYNMKLLHGSEQVLSRLKWHWSVDPGTAQDCSQCGECEEKCTQKLPIRDRMKEIAALAAEQKK